MALMTDEYGAYRGLGKEFASHETVTHKAGEYVRGHVYTNTAESFNGLLKRAITGAFHSVSRRHLDLYLDEFQFRWNARDMTDEGPHRYCDSGRGRQTPHLRRTGASTRRPRWRLGLRTMFGRWTKS